MSNPTNLQELADSLAEQAHTMRADDDRVMYGSYVDALLDTRATVLAMIEDINRRIAANNQVLPEAANALSAQALLDGRIEAYEDVRGETQPEPGVCPTCGALYGEMDHAPEPCEEEMAKDAEEAGPTWASAEEIDAGIPAQANEGVECPECGHSTVVLTDGSLCCPVCDWTQDKVVG